MCPYCPILLYSGNKDIVAFLVYFLISLLLESLSVYMCLLFHIGLFSFFKEMEKSCVDREVREDLGGIRGWKNKNKIHCIIKFKD